MNQFIISIALLFFTIFVDQANAQYHLGPRGGCYKITKSGRKSYVDRSLCTSSGRTPPSALDTAESHRKDSPKESAVPSGNSSKYRRGPRGGCYTIAPSGAKRYVDRSMCQ